MSSNSLERSLPEDTMKTPAIIARLLAAAPWRAGAPARAQGAEWETLNKEVMSLCQKGQ